MSQPKEGKSFKVTAHGEIVMNVKGDNEEWIKGYTHATLNQQIPRFIIRELEVEEVP